MYLSSFSSLPLSTRCTQRCNGNRTAVSQRIKLCIRIHLRLRLQKIRIHSLGIHSSGGNERRNILDFNGPRTSANGPLLPVPAITTTTDLTSQRLDRSRLRFNHIFYALSRILNCRTRMSLGNLSRLRNLRGGGNNRACGRYSLHLIYLLE